jgi:GntR family transcriptional regulator
MSMMHGLPVDQRLPLYQRLRDDFARRIADGEWRPGEPIPPEETLAKVHGGALGTVRKAIEGLATEGRVERQQGRGTFVRRTDFSSAFARFFRVTDAAGRAIQPVSRILSREKLPAPATIAKQLGLEIGAPAIHLRRQRLVGGTPILGETIWLDAARFEPLMAIAPADFGDLLYPLYESHCGAIVASARETLRFGALDAATSALLDMPAGAPVAIIDRLAFGFDDRVLEVRHTCGAADHFVYSIDIR